MTEITNQVKRQVCRKCLKTCVPAMTLTFNRDDRAWPRRLHWCAKHIDDAERYRDSADQ